MAKRLPVPPEAIRVAAALVFMAAAYFLWQPDTFWSVLSKWLLIFLAGLTGAYNLMMLGAMGLGLYLRQRDPAAAGKALGAKGRVFLAPRWHDGVVAVICASFPAALDIWLFDAQPPLAVLSTALFGFFALYNLAQVISPSQLRLTENGFEVSGAFGSFKRIVAWCDIEPLFVFVIGAPLPPGTVAYRYIEGREPSLDWWQRSLTNLRGGIFMLPLGLDLESVALSELMNQMRTQSLAAAGETGAATAAQRKRALAVYGHDYSPDEAHQLFVRIGLFTLVAVLLMLALGCAVAAAGSRDSTVFGADQNIGLAAFMVSLVWLVFVLSGQSTLSFTPRRGFVLAGLRTHPKLYWMTVASFALLGSVGALLGVFRPFSR